MLGYKTVPSTQSYIISSYLLARRRLRDRASRPRAVAVGLCDAFGVRRTNWQPEAATAGTTAASADTAHLAAPGSATLHSLSVVPACCGDADGR